jgi:diadenosine tetraphosphatase ApaH/serine/threonine PP2A family protein phosphatase
MGDAVPRGVAVLADVHGNTAALRAVLADADGLGVDEIVVAGDMVGFGPEPDAVVDLLRRRDARMIRGNHEKDYASPYGTPAMPAWWATSRRLVSFRWSMARLGPARRAFLAGLPDRLELDEATLIVHGSPRAVRDAVLPWSKGDDLEAMFASDPCRLAFMGHTHRPVIHDLPTRRLVNVGSVGFPLDGDPRACYVLAERTDGGWRVETRRVTYDVAATIGAYDADLRAADPGYVELMTRQLRSGRDYLGPWFRGSEGVPDEGLDAALERYLDAHP